MTTAAGGVRIAEVNRMLVDQHDMPREVLVVACEKGGARSNSVTTERPLRRQQRFAKRRMNGRSRPNHAVQQQIARSRYPTFNAVEDQTKGRAATTTMQSSPPVATHGTS
jgi:hypothetical protein